MMHVAAQAALAKKALRESGRSRTGHGDISNEL
jgi:hypothetical protein